MIGNCVSQGYLGNSKNSINYLKFKSEKAYLTGDLGYMDNKNYLHIVGRKDNTIKISGYRVDVLELEKLITINFDVRNACLLKMNINGTNILCLAIETKNKIQIEKILNFLKKNFHDIQFLKEYYFLNVFP